MKASEVILLMDALSLMNGHKTLSEMIGEIPVRKPQCKPHQGNKEIARRLKQMQRTNHDTK